MSKEKIKKRIEGFEELRANLTSENGYPIYDLMIPVQKGYIGASGVVFYSEDENKIKELSNLRTLEEQKAFLLKNVDDIAELYELKNQGLKEMPHPISMAFAHLSDKKSFQHTLKSGSYGVAHLVVGNELLIFHQNQGVVRDIYNSNYTKIDLTNVEVYSDTQEKLAKLYAAGKATPDGKIVGKAFDKIMSVFLGVDYYQLNKYQKETLFMFTDFLKEIDQNVKLKMEFSNGTNKVIFQYDNKKLEVVLPIENKKSFQIKDEENEELVKSNLPEVLYYIQKKVSESKVQNFINKLQW